MPRSFLVKKRQDQLQQQQQSGAENTVADDSLLRNYSNGVWNGFSSSQESVVDAGRASFSVGLSSSNPFNGKHAVVTSEILINFIFHPS